MEGVVDVTTGRIQSSELAVEVGMDDQGMDTALEAIMNLPQGDLTGIELTVLLKSVRVGAVTDVVCWAATLGELIALARKWEADNPTATRETYVGDWDYVPGPDYWKELLECAWKDGVTWTTYYTCPEEHRFKENTMGLCPVCYEQDMESHFTDCTSEKVVMGPRGKDTYNFTIHGAEEWNLALAFFQMRGREIPIPEEFAGNKIWLSRRRCGHMLAGD